MSLRIRPIPAFADNYIWLLQSAAGVAVVDPGDAAPLLQILHEEGLRLDTILVTHHHTDHTGGIAALMQSFPQVRVIGPHSDRIPLLQERVGEGDLVQTIGLRFEVMEIPGHTLDHIAYHLPLSQENSTPALFCGDTLFAGGCGRIFEGTPSMMLNSLYKLQKLSPHTLLYCAHEYTQANLRFAMLVEPNNADLAARAKNVDALRATGEPTLPSNLDVELRTNPFLRCHIQTIAQRVAQHSGASTADPLSTFAHLRAWKDHF